MNLNHHTSKNQKKNSIQNANRTSHIIVFSPVNNDQDMKSQIAISPLIQKISQVHYCISSKAIRELDHLHGSDLLKDKPYHLFALWQSQVFCKLSKVTFAVRSFAQIASKLSHKFLDNGHRVKLVRICLDTISYVSALILRVHDEISSPKFGNHGNRGIVC